MSSSLPTTLDFLHYSGDAFSRSLSVVNSDGTDFDFTGYTAVAYVMLENTIITPITVNLTTGNIALTIDESIIQNLPDNPYTWYITLTHSGDSRTWLTGYFKLDKESTESSSPTEVTVTIENVTLTISSTVYGVQTEYKEAILKILFNNGTLSLDSTVLNKIGGNFSLQLSGGYYYILNSNNLFGSNASKVITQCQLIASTGDVWTSFVYSGEYINSGSYKITSLPGKELTNTYLISIKIYT